MVTLQIEAVRMLDRIEIVFRSIKSASTAGDVLVATLVGLEELIDGARARVRIESFNLTLKIRGSKLESCWLISSEEEDEVFQEARESREAVVSTSGIDEQRLHCHVIPFHGGLVYIDHTRPFSGDEVSVARMITQQADAHLGTSHLAVAVSNRDSLTDLPNQCWFDNRLNDYSEFSVIALDIDGFTELNQRKGRKTGDQVLLELAGFLRHHLQGAELMARSECDEFLVLSLETDKPTLGALWQGLIATFEEITLSISHNLTLSAGIATYPADASYRQSVREIAQTACHKASRLGNRVLTVATWEQVHFHEAEDPKAHFDMRAAAVVRAAVEECQSSRRQVDGLAIVWGLLACERDFSRVLRQAGLKQSELREQMALESETSTVFSAEAKQIFAQCLTDAHRAGRKTIGVFELLLGCLGEARVEHDLTQCGLSVGSVLTGLYRQGHFSSADTMLIGDLAMTYQRVRTLPARKRVKKLGPTFGNNFDAEVWSLIAEAREEAKLGNHDMGLEHLYLAFLSREGKNLERARELLVRIGLPLVGQESPMPTAELLEFFHKLDSNFEEVRVEIIRSKLYLEPQVVLLRELLDD